MHSLWSLAFLLFACAPQEMQKRTSTLKKDKKASSLTGDVPSGLEDQTSENKPVQVQKDKLRQLSLLLNKKDEDIKALPSGSQVQITWNGTGMKKCQILPFAEQTNNSDWTSLKGDKTTDPLTETMVIRLQCSDDHSIGESFEKLLAINIKPAKVSQTDSPPTDNPPKEAPSAEDQTPKILAFQVSGSSSKEVDGTPFFLSWDLQGQMTCALTQTDGTKIQDGISTSGQSSMITLTESVTYILKCESKDGSIVPPKTLALSYKTSDSANGLDNPPSPPLPSVDKPAIVSFQVNGSDSLQVENKPFTLNWILEGQMTCSITQNDGKKVQDGITASGESAPLSISAAQIYTMDCTAQDGSPIKSKTLAVAYKTVE